MNNRRSLGKNGLVDGVGRSGEASLPSLLESWANTYSPLVLLGFDEDSGTTAVDSSGNGNDGTYEGEIGYNETTVFDGANLAVSLGVPGVAQGKLNVPTLSPSSNSTTFALAYGEDSLEETFMWDTSGGTRCVLGHQGNNGPLGFYAGSWTLTGYKCRGPAFIHWTFREASSSANVSIRGLPIAELPWTPTLLGTSSGYINARYTGGSVLSPRKYAIAERLDTDLSHGEIYQQALDVGAAPDGGHYYKETIVDDFGLATLGQQGDVLCHLPLWETAGPQAVDVSMYENHFDFVGGPLLGQDPPPDSGLLYSVELDGSSYLERTTGLGFDPSTTDWTMWTWIRPDGFAANRNVFGVQDGSGAFFRLSYRNDPDADLFTTIHDGATFVQERSNVALTLGEWALVALRVDVSAGAADIVLNGSVIVTLDFSSLTMPDLSTADVTFGAATGFSRLHGGLAGSTIISKKLTNTELEVL